LICREKFCEEAAVCVRAPRLFNEFITVKEEVSTPDSGARFKGLEDCYKIA
jgi:hypothetical protein